MIRIKIFSKSIIVFLFLFVIPLVIFSSEGLYEGWESVLKDYVKGGRVDYSALLKSPDPLHHFLENVKKLPREEYERWSLDGKIAFWINVYNASAIKLILDHYPLKKRFGIKRSEEHTSELQSPTNL